MIHKWLSNDNGKECYRCGVAIDYLPDPDNGDERDEADIDLIEDDISWLLPFCNGPMNDPAHHYVAVGSNDYVYNREHENGHRVHWIECHRCDARIGWETDLTQVPRYCKEI